MATLEELKKAQKKLQKKNKPLEEVGYLEGLMQSGVGQGLMFGFGDEARAKVQSWKKGTKYEDELQKERDKLASFRQTNPYSAYGSEILGSLPTAIAGGAGLAGLGMRGGAKIGATQGAIYGAGVGEDAESRTKGAIGGAVLGGGISKVADKILPKATELAKKFLANDIRLTAGQTVKGTGFGFGDLAHGLEQSSTSIPGVGASISLAKTRAVSDFNKYAMLEAIDSILDKKTKKALQAKLKNLHGTEAFDVVDELVTAQYNKVLPKLKLQGQGVYHFEDKIIKSIANADVDDVAKDILLKRMDTLFNNKIKINKSGERFISGKNLKVLMEDLFDEGRSFKIKGGTDRYTGMAFDKIRKELKTIIDQYNPKSGLNEVNLAFGKLKPIGEAVLMAFNTKGVFSAGQFLRALRKVDRSVGKRISKKGKNPMLGLAREGDELLGDFVPDSGTASRLIAGASAINPELIKQLIVPTGLAQLAYGSLLGLGRRALTYPNPLLRNLAPITGGLLGEETYDTGSQGINKARNALQARLQQ